jgi:hypothetical protein
LPGVAVIQINISADVEKLTRHLRGVERKQIPFATAQALTASATGAKADVRAKMPSIFDRPTAWTLNSIYVQKANKNRLEADIHLKDEPQKGIPAGKYLQWQITGGPRAQKSFEKRLSAAGIGTTGFFAPAYGADFDGNGNMNTGQLTKILSDMNALNDVAAKGLNGRRRGARKKEQYVVVNGGNAPYKRGNGLRPGIYKRVAALVIPVLWFIPRPQYKAIFPFPKLGAESMARRFPAEFRKALGKALATAR